MELTLALAIVAIVTLAVIGCAAWKDIKALRAELDAEKLRVERLFELMRLASTAYEQLTVLVKLQAAATTALDQNAVKKSELQ